MPKDGNRSQPCFCLHRASVSLSLRVYTFCVGTAASPERTEERANPQLLQRRARKFVGQNKKGAKYSLRAATTMVRCVVLFVTPVYCCGFFCTLGCGAPGRLCRLLADKVAMPVLHILDNPDESARSRACCAQQRYNAVFWSRARRATCAEYC